MDPNQNQQPVPLPPPPPPPPAQNTPPQSAAAAPQPQDLIARLLAHKVLLIAIVGVLFLLAIITPLLLSATADKTPGRIFSMKNHLASLTEVVQGQTKQLDSSSLRDQNVNLSILLSGATNDLTAAITEASFAATTADTAGAARNAARLAAITKAVEEAIQTNTVDMEYQRQISTELKVVETQLATLAREIKRQKMRATLVEIADRLKQGREAFEKVSL